ncbi:hypothetical protein [Actinomadura sp. CNU-125]|nr:hypothetical protein [Actinomadura sp. CNU-125]
MLRLDHARFEEFEVAEQGGDLVPFAQGAEAMRPMRPERMP